MWSTRVFAVLNVLFLTVSVCASKADQCPTSLHPPIGETSADYFASAQKYGRPPAREAKFVAQGKKEGGNTYTIISDMSNWWHTSLFSGDAQFIAHPMTVRSNPYSFSLTWDLLNCYLRRGVAVLLSDGAYNHFVELWEYDSKRRRYGIVDENPDTFFLADGNNLFGIKAQREDIKAGPTVHWIAENDFRLVFSELLYVADVADFDAAYEKVTEEQKAQLAYSAFLSFAVSSDDTGIEISLNYAKHALDHLNGLSTESRARFPNELGAVLAIAKLMNGRPPSYALLPKEIQITDWPFIVAMTYRGDHKPVRIDDNLILELEGKLKSAFTLSSEFEYLEPGSKREIAIGPIERLLLHRLARTLILYVDQSESDKVSELLKHYPDDPRMMLYLATLGLLTKPPPEALIELQTTASNVETLMLKTAGAPNLRAFRQAMYDYEVETDVAEVPFTAWTSLVIAGRRLADEVHAKEVAREFATRDRDPPSLDMFFNQPDEFILLSNMVADANRQRGLPCRAGCAFLYMVSNRWRYRCLSDQSTFG
jgi:hypothetical protein